MNYQEFNKLQNKAWNQFLKVFDNAGVDTEGLSYVLDFQDCYNGVEDALLSVIILDEDDE